MRVEQDISGEEPPGTYTAMNSATGHAMHMIPGIRQGTTTMELIVRGQGCVTKGAGEWTDTKTVAGHAHPHAPIPFENIVTG